MKKVASTRKEWKKAGVRYQIPHIRKVFIRKPAVLKLLGNIRGKKIVDLGCGDGYYSRFFAKNKAQVTGIDFSPTSIAIAEHLEKKEKLGIKYFHADIAHLPFLKNESFDIALAEMVLVTIPTQKKLRAIVKEVKRIIRKNGILVISKGHPTAFFDRTTEFYKWSFDNPKTSYFDSLSPQRVKMNIAGKMIKFTNYHRTLEDFLRPWLNEGFVVSDIREPKPNKFSIKRFPHHLDTKIPYFIIFKLQKQK